MRKSKRIENYTSSQSGFTLIELMVGLLIGTIIIGGIILSWSLAIRSNSYILSTTALNSDLRSIMQVMTQDIRRATPDALHSSVFLFPDYTADDSTVNSASCILYLAAIASPIADTAEDQVHTSGFRLHEGNLQMWFDASDNLDFTATSNLVSICESSTEDKWFDLHTSGERGINIEALEIRADHETIAGQTKIRSLCLDLNRAAGSSIDPASELGRCAIDAENSVEVVFLDITVSGTIALPGGIQDFSISDAVKVRNDRVIPPQ